MTDIRFASVSARPVIVTRHSVPRVQDSSVLKGPLTSPAASRRVKKVKDVLEWGVPEWRALLQGKEFTDDDDGLRRVITDIVFSHEDDVYYAKYIIKGEKDIKKNHDYTILRQVFDMAREGGDDWVEDRFYKGKKIE